MIESKKYPPLGILALGAADVSPSGYISRSPVPSSTVVLKLWGTSTSVPSNRVNGFQPASSVPSNDLRPSTPITSAPSGSRSASSTSPSIWYGSITLTRQRPSPSIARRSLSTTDTWTPVTKLAPKSTQTRSGWRC